MDRKNYIILTVIATFILMGVSIGNGEATLLIKQGVYGKGYDLKNICTIIFFLDYLAMLVGTYHRCKYRGKSGWNCLWLFVPVISFIYPIYNCIKR